MGVYIKGMEMPKNCLACDWCAHTIPADNYICYRLNRAVIGVAKEDVDETVNACCPIVPVPPHGRLIDADALLERFEKEEKAADEHGRDFSFSFKSGGENCTEWWPVQQMLTDAPTIIEAEEGE